MTYYARQPNQLGGFSIQAVLWKAPQRRDKSRTNLDAGVAPGLPHQPDSLTSAQHPPGRLCWWGCPTFFRETDGQCRRSVLGSSEQRAWLLALDRGEGRMWIWQIQFMVCDGVDSDILWVTAIQDTGECWTFSNEDIRFAKNITIGRRVDDRPLRKAPSRPPHSMGRMLRG